MAKSEHKCPSTESGHNFSDAGRLGRKKDKMDWTSLSPGNGHRWCHPLDAIQHINSRNSQAAVRRHAFTMAFWTDLVDVLSKSLCNSLGRISGTWRPAVTSMSGMFESVSEVGHSNVPIVYLHVGVIQCYTGMYSSGTSQAALNLSLFFWNYELVQLLQVLP
jgi:hypothetical protein